MQFSIILSNKSWRSFPAACTAPPCQPVAVWVSPGGPRPHAPLVGSSRKRQEGFATSSTAMVRRLRPSVLRPLTPGEPTSAPSCGVRSTISATSSTYDRTFAQITQNRERHAFRTVPDRMESVGMGLQGRMSSDPCMLRSSHLCIAEGLRQAQARAEVQSLQHRLCRRVDVELLHVSAIKVRGKNRSGTKFQGWLALPMTPGSVNHLSL